MATKIQRRPGNHDSAIEQSAHAVGDIIETGATVVGAD